MGAVGLEGLRDMAVEAGNVVAIVLVVIAALVANDGDFLDVLEADVEEGTDKCEVEDLVEPRLVVSVPADARGNVRMKSRE